MVAVVVPVRNTSDWHQTVESVQSGNTTPVEFVVVDDGSDPPIQSTRDSPVHILRIAPSGPAAARNAGAAATTSDVIIFVDADVTVREYTVARLVQVLETAPSDVAAIQAIYAEQTPDLGFATQFQNALQRYNFLAVRDAEHFSGLSSFCIAIRRHAFEAVGGFDAAVHRATVEDDTLGLELIRAGWRVQLAKDVEVIHRASYRSLSLCHRMYRMASDKVRSIRRKPWVARTNISNSHHRPEFIGSTASVGLGMVALPFAPDVSIALVAVAILCQLPFLISVTRRRGIIFGMRSAGMILGLAAAAAVGCVAGLLG